jgi:hypothetical protein
MAFPRGIVRPAPKKPLKPLVPNPQAGPDPKFYYDKPVHKGPKPPLQHPVLRGRGEPAPPEYAIKGKTYRSDTGGTVKVGKATTRLKPPIKSPGKRKG